MSMTTPRVTVPVDELAQEIRRVDGNHDLGAGALAEALMPFLSSRLSAAPAPEGGAVLANDLRCLKETFERIAARPPEDQPHYKSGVRPFGTGDLRHIIEVLTKAAALATREEAPWPRPELAPYTEDLKGIKAFMASEEAQAELSGNTGELEAPAEAREVLDLLTHAKDAVHKIAALRSKIGPIASQAQTAGWAITLAMRHLRAQPPAATSNFVGRAKHFLDLAEKAEDDALGGNEGCVWPVEALRAAYADLTAKPLSREDAQPVAWVPLHPRNGPIWPECGPDARSKDNLKSYPFMAVYTHAAPDALREDSQAWGMLADLVSWFTKPVQGQNGMVWVIPAGDQGADDAVAAALAALQAEQKGGAA